MAVRCASSTLGRWRRIEYELASRRIHHSIVVLDVECPRDAVHCRRQCEPYSSTVVGYVSLTREHVVLIEKPLNDVGVVKRALGGETEGRRNFVHPANDSDLVFQYAHSSSMNTADMLTSPEPSVAALPYSSSVVVLLQALDVGASSGDQFKVR
jgi:hypothetical protein